MDIILEISRMELCRGGLCKNKKCKKDVGNWKANKAHDSGIYSALSG